jgi:hypothetical protein
MQPRKSAFAVIRAIATGPVGVSTPMGRHLVPRLILLKAK